MSEPDALVQSAPAPHRLTRALQLLTPSEGQPGKAYAEAQHALVREFGIAMSTAAEDLRRAYEVIRARLQATDLPSVIRTEMEALARDAHANGDRGVASVTWFRLGRLSGMTDESESSLVQKLSDAALDAAIGQAVAERIERMDESQLEELLRRKRGQTHPGEGEPT